MDCQKKNRTSALFHPAIYSVTSQFERDAADFCGSTDSTPPLAISTHPTGKPDQKTMQKQRRNRYHGIACGWKLPARLVPAVAAATVVFCCMFVTSHTVQGETPPEVQTGEVQELIDQLAQVDFDQRKAAEQKLIEIGSPAVDSLIRTLPNCTPDVCSRIKQILLTVAGDSNEESLFKILAALRIRFELPAERIYLLQDQWAVKRREAVVARWRKQGAIVDDPYEHVDLADQRAQFEDQMRLQRAREQDFQFGDIDKNGNINPPPNKDVVGLVSPKKQVVQQPIAERLKRVLAGSIEQNKELVLGLKKNANGFENSMNMLWTEPVSVTIGADWKGDYSIFDFAKSRTNLLISNLQLQEKEINDSLLSVLRKHPLVSVTMNKCSVAPNTSDMLPESLRALVIENSDNPAKILDLVSSNSSALNTVGFLSSKFGETEAAALSGFSRLLTVELAKIDLQGDAFEGLASLGSLRTVEIDRCKFPSAAFLRFQRERPGLIRRFTAKAFLGVSGEQLGRAVGCLIVTVVPGKAADRAGIKPGDVVSSVGDQEVNNFDELRVAIAQFEIGEEVAIKVRRNGKEEALKATLGVPDEPY